LSKTDSIPKVGQIVRILQGREAGQFAVVIENIDNRFVYLADGDKRKYDRPKKKNVRHIEVTDYISEDVQSSLLNTGRVTNGKLRFTISKFVDMYESNLKKGDQQDGERRSN